MKQKWMNSVTVQGYIFSHTLQNRTSKKGVPYISGIIRVATDESASNVVDVHFGYVTETFGKSGKSNQSYSVLQNIIDNSKTWEMFGEGSTKVRISGNVDVNDFYNREGELVSAKRVSGSFVHVIDNMPNGGFVGFNVDMIISGCVERERDDMPSYLDLRGYVFNFRNDILPITLSVHEQSGIDYFLGQDISNNNPMVTNVRGEIISTTIVQETEIEGAFGAPQVRTSTREFRAWDVTWAAPEPQEWDDESTITKKELKQALADREVYLAEQKQRQEEYRNNKNGSQSFDSTVEKAPAPIAEPDDDDVEFEF